MDTILSSVQPKFQKVVDVVKADLATIRTGKATPALIENVVAEAYGTKMKMVELVTIAVVDANTLIVTPFDIGNASAIAKAIQDANLGLTAIPEDTKVRVVVPPLSEERRQEYVKLAKSKVEGGKVMSRQVRHEAMEEATKGNFDEDTQKRLEKEIQNLTDKTSESLDQLLSEKEAELMTV